MSGIGIGHASVQRKIRGGLLNPVRQMLTNERIRGWAQLAGHVWRERQFCPVISLLVCILKHLGELSAQLGHQVIGWALGRSGSSSSTHRDIRHTF